MLVTKSLIKLLVGILTIVIPIIAQASDDKCEGKYTAKVLSFTPRSRTATDTTAQNQQSTTIAAPVISLQSNTEIKTEVESAYSRLLKLVEKFNSIGLKRNFTGSEFNIKNELENRLEEIELYLKHAPLHLRHQIENAMFLDHVTVSLSGIEIKALVLVGPSNTERDSLNPASNNSFKILLALPDSAVSVAQDGSKVLTDELKQEILKALKANHDNILQKIKWADGIDPLDRPKNAPTVFDSLVTVSRLDAHRAFRRGGPYMLVDLNDTINRLITPIKAGQLKLEPDDITTDTNDDAITVVSLTNIAAENFIGDYRINTETGLLMLEYLRLLHLPESVALPAQIKEKRMAEILMQLAPIFTNPELMALQNKLRDPYYNVNRSRELVIWLTSVLEVQEEQTSNNLISVEDHLMALDLSTLDDLVTLIKGLRVPEPRDREFSGSLK